MAGGAPVAEALSDGHWEREQEASPRTHVDSTGKEAQHLSDHKQKENSHAVGQFLFSPSVS